MAQIFKGRETAFTYKPMERAVEVRLRWLMPLIYTCLSLFILYMALFVYERSGGFAGILCIMAAIIFLNAVRYVLNMRTPILAVQSEMLWYRDGFFMDLIPIGYDDISDVLVVRSPGHVGLEIVTQSHGVIGIDMHLCNADADAVAGEIRKRIKPFEIEEDRPPKFDLKSVFNQP